MQKIQAIIYSDAINVRLSAEKLATFVRWSGPSLDSGHVFIFFNRKHDHCKIIWHDGEGYYEVQKKLERGLFAPNDKIKISQAAIENCVRGGLRGNIELLHELMGNLKYIDDVRSENSKL